MFICDIVPLALLGCKEDKNTFPPWMFVLGALLEDGIPVPEILGNASFFQILSGCWILMAVFPTVTTDS